MDRFVMVSRAKGFLPVLIFILSPFRVYHARPGRAWLNLDAFRPGPVVKSFVVQDPLAALGVIEPGEVWAGAPDTGVKLGSVFLDPLA
jgi:hypothetical protein